MEVREAGDVSAGDFCRRGLPRRRAQLRLRRRSSFLNTSGLQWTAELLRHPLPTPFLNSVSPPPARASFFSFFFSFFLVPSIHLHLRHLLLRQMEGLIPFVYRAIVQYRNGGQPPAWLGDSPSGSYMRLPGDSGRLRAVNHEFQFLSSPPRRAPAATPPPPAQSPLRRTTSRRPV